MSQLVKYFELLALIAGVANWGNIKYTPFVKNLVWVIGFITIFDFIGYFLWKNHYNNLWFYNLIAIPFTFGLYSFIFYQNFKNTKYKKLALLLFVSVLIGYATACIFINVKKEFCTIGYCFGSAVLATFAILKISELISNNAQPDFLKIPLFFLILSLLIYYLVTIPFYSISYLFFNKPSMKNLIAVLYTSTAILNYCLYTSYIFTFLWERKKPSY